MDRVRLCVVNSGGLLWSGDMVTDQGKRLRLKTIREMKTDPPSSLKYGF